MELLESHFNQLQGNLIQEGDTYEMFSTHQGIPKHLNYLTFKRLFEEMKPLKQPMILESGIASQGTNSTYLFNEYVRKYGGFFWSVDVNPYLVEKNKGNMCPATTLVCQDSVSFFESWTKEHDTAHVIYLDSYDLDFYNHEPSGKHGLAEYNSLIPSIKKDTLLLIDDTPSSPYWLDTRGKVYEDMVRFYDTNAYLPGKGMYVMNEITNADKLLHQYQLLYKFTNSP